MSPTSIIIQLEGPYDHKGRGLLPGRYVTTHWWRYHEEAGWYTFRHVGPIKLENLTTYLLGAHSGFAAHGGNPAKLLIAPGEIDLGAAIPSCRLVELPVEAG